MPYFAKAPWRVPVHYATTREIIVPEGTQKIMVQLPTALNASLFAYSQRALSFSISYSKKPDEVAATNGGITATWVNPPSRLSYTIVANLTIDVRVDGLNSNSQLPIRLNSSDQGASRYPRPFEVRAIKRLRHQKNCGNPDQQR